MTTANLRALADEWSESPGRAWVSELGDELHAALDANRATDPKPVAYRLTSGRIVHQTYAQRWVNEDGYPLALTPDLTDAVALYYTEDPS